ncbi:hypothetical protein L2E82_41571 [Cichorium intybus]|uniref:Uncharacterized protein n=1 Tax=Cichorium intybus TaxID=13427 RepID=A0ACB9AMK1_CICIN|nr:hypothetical protein L2E82_41571 [Cichorium intybus]
MNPNYYTNLLSSNDPENPNNPPQPPYPNPYLNSPYSLSPHPPYPNPYPNPYQNPYQNSPYPNPHPNTSLPDPSQNPEKEPTPEETPTNKRSKPKKTYWSKEEEILLAKAWLHISSDSITGSQQRDKEFWQRIATYYESNNTSNIVRNQANLKSHWHYMNPLVLAFNQTYSVLKSQHLSGWSEDDLKNGALEQYRARYNADFRHDQIWNILKHEPKWLPSSAPSGASRSSSNVESFINLDNDEVTARPIGRNAAKKAAKGKVANSSSSSGSRLDEILEKHIEENKKSFERYQKSLDVKNALKEKKMKIKEEKVKNDEISILFMDPSTMSEDGREIWRNRCDQIKIKYNM